MGSLGNLRAEVQKSAPRNFPNLVVMLDMERNEILDHERAPRRPTSYPARDISLHQPAYRTTRLTNEPKESHMTVMASDSGRRWKWEESVALT